MEPRQVQKPENNTINPRSAALTPPQALILLLLYSFKSLLDESPLRVDGHNVVKLAVHNSVVIQKLFNCILTNPLPL